MGAALILHYQARLAQAVVRVDFEHYLQFLLFLVKPTQLQLVRVAQLAADIASEQVRAGIAEAVAAAQDVDVIIAALGETDELCRESVSRISLNLPGYQEELLQALCVVAPRGTTKAPCHGPGCLSTASGRSRQRSLHRFGY